MKSKTKIGIAFGAIVFALIISPVIDLSEAEATKKSTPLVKTISTTSDVVTVKIVGLDEISFAPNTIDISKGDTVTFLTLMVPMEGRII